MIAQNEKPTNTDAQQEDKNTEPAEQQTSNADEKREPDTEPEPEETLYDLGDGSDGGGDASGAD